MTLRIAQRWGRTKGKIGFHGGKVAVHRPRVRSYDGHEVVLPTWTAAQAEDWLAKADEYGLQAADYDCQTWMALAAIARTTA